MVTAGLILAGIAAGIHVYIFVLESLRWTAPSTRKSFGIRTAEEAEVMKTMAFNQGFYNLFLGLGALAGAVMVGNGGSAMLAVYTCLFMTGAAIVLLSRYPAMWPAALVQGGPPALAVLALALAG